jgi:hypothetical protein
VRINKEEMATSPLFLCKGQAFTCTLKGVPDLRLFYGIHQNNTEQRCPRKVKISVCIKYIKVFAFIRVHLWLSSTPGISAENPAFMAQ